LPPALFSWVYQEECPTRLTQCKCVVWSLTLALRKEEAFTGLVNHNALTDVLSPLCFLHLRQQYTDLTSYVTQVPTWAASNIVSTVGRVEEAAGWRACSPTPSSGSLHAPATLWQEWPGRNVSPGLPELW
jgi:hypothetical protein